jgi:hypothetical protein
LNWYIWCVKTGHGHLDEAEALADRYVRDLSLSSGLKADSDRADYLLAQGKTDDAMYLFRKIAKETGESWAAVDAALWCAATKDDNRCDELLDIVTNLRQPVRRSAGVADRPGLFQLAKLFQACRWVQHDPELDLTEVEQLMQANELERPSMLYFTAKFLEIRGHEAEARRFYTRCVATHGNGELNRMLSAMELRKRGIDPMVVAYAAPTTASVTSQPFPR